MAIEFIKDEKDYIQVKMVGENRAICALVARQLSENSEVEFAGCSEDHPLLGNPILTVKGKGAKKNLAEAIDEAKKQIAELEKAVASL